MESQSIVKPRLTVLTPDQIEQVHAYSLQILSRTGLRVDSSRAGNIFASAEGAAFVDETRVVLQPELVEWAIQCAPPGLDMYNRHGEPAFHLKAGSTHFGAGVTNLYYQDPVTDEVALFSREHMGKSVRLASALSSYDVISTIGILRDVDPGQADLYAVLEMVANTDKPLVLLVSDERQFTPVLDLFSNLYGELAEKPFIIPYFNPISPLVLNEGTSDKMLESIQRGLPLIYSNYGMVGSSTPITPAATLALLNAELLAGLVFSQLVKPGTPVILGSLPAFFDMKSMIDFYDPLTMLLNLACAEMMAHYHVPHAGTSGSGNGWSADLIASEALWINHLTSCLGKVGLVPFTGGVLGSKVFSPAMLVYSDEIIEQARFFAAGFGLEDEQVALDEIEAAGPGGNFLDSDLTLKNFRSAYHSSKIFPRLSLEKWQEKGNPRASQYLRDRTIQLIETQSPPEDHDQLLASGEAFIHQVSY